MARENKSKTKFEKHFQILIVDDNDSLLKFFKIHLNRFFPKVFAAISAKDGLSFFENESIDLVIADIDMPKVSGIQFAKKVKKIDPSVSVLLISEAQPIKKIQMVDKILVQPFSMDALHDSIHFCLDRRRRMKLISGYIKDPADFRSLIDGTVHVGQVAETGEEAELVQVLLNEMKGAA